MRPPILRRAFAVVVVCLAAVAPVTAQRAAENDRQEKLGLAPEQERIIGEFSSEIGNIPRELYGNNNELQEYIKKHPELRQLEPNEDFQRAITVLAGIGRQRGEKTRGGGGDRARYEEDYLRSLALRISKQPWVFAEIARRAYARKDYQTALRDYEQAAKLDPANRKALLGYGHSARELGDYRLALMAARQLLQRQPGDKDALGLYHFANGRTPTVSLPSAIFQTGAIFSAGDRDLTGSRGDNSSPYGSVGSEPAASQRRVEAGPGAVERSAQITREAGAALGMKDYPTAHELAGKAIALNASNAQALNFRAIASNRMLRFAGAVTDTGAALALAPGNASALQTRSWAFAKLGRYQEALRDAVDTLARDPANPYAYQNKALALAGLRDRAGALDALRRSAALDASFLNRYERALQLPQETDLTFLFDDDSGDRAIGRGNAARQKPSPSKIPLGAAKRFARLAALSAVGGVLIALGLLHVVSAGWREKVRATIRRALAPFHAPSHAVDSAFWTQYEFVKEIGLGGMGVVYEAKDRSLDRRVAVKKMRDEIRVDPHERRRFVNEAKLVASLRHPNIVDIYAISEDGDDVYLVFEFVEGRTLHERIKSEAPMTLEAARGVLGAAASAVEHAHAHQIVHRDLKPSNIMIASDGRVKVMDFGVARQAKDAITQMSMTNSVMGTPSYMAPEQEQGSVRRESDVYALGVCLYEMLTGQLPFAGGGAAMLLSKLNGKHIPPTSRDPSLPAALDEVIAKALTPDPDKRYHTPTELVAALDAVKAR